MFNFLRKNKKVKDVAKEQLEKNRAVIESLRDYDEGKKDISTTHIKERLRDLQSSS